MIAPTAVSGVVPRLMERSLGGGTLCKKTVLSDLARSGPLPCRVELLDLLFLCPICWLGRCRGVLGRPKLEFPLFNSLLSVFDGIVCRSSVLIFSCVFIPLVR